MPLIQLIKENGIRWGVVCLSLVFTLSLTLYQIVSAPYDTSSFIKRLDYLFYDWRYNLLLDENRFERAEANIVIVDIDEESLKVEGRWPWSRDKLATMVDRLAEAGAVVIGFDVLMAEPQINPTEELQRKARAIGRPDVAEALNTFKDETAYDEILARSFENVDVLLPFLFHDTDTIAVGQLPYPVASIDPSDAQNILTVDAYGYTASVPLLQDASVGGGFIVPTIDGDGVLRRAPLVQRYGNDLYPALSLAMGLSYYLLDSIELELEVFRKNLLAVKGFQFADKNIITDFRGGVLVPYLGGERQYPYIPATDVLNNNVEPGTFKNALVLVGTSSVGLADLRSTPVGTQYPGVEVHANLLNSLLVGEFPYDWEYANEFTALVLFILGLLFTLFSNRFGPFALLLATLTLLASLLTFNLYFWLEQNASLPLASSILLTLGLGAIHLLEGFLSERMAKQHVTSVFGQYVPSEHISHMLEAPDKYGFEGETRDMTVLFSDIRSFTTISENLSATELKDLLNRYFTPITESIFNHQGTIDKYVGDMVMAFWGAPLDDEDHAEHALAAAVDMLEVLKKLNPELAALGYPEIKVGIGLNSGQMNVGDMGSNFRKAYTVLGDAVNLGSRLESLTKYYFADILVGPETKAQCHSWAFRLVDKIQVKGKLNAVDVYEPIVPIDQLTESWTSELQKHDHAWQAYLAKDWHKANTLFSELAQSSQRPHLYKVLLERITGLASQTLPDNWEGTFIHENK
ncbi:adenylate/guanylate cyclase domain-containing protein [Reinekea forsetii]|nr:adenylate/guanylate cyclase domain-containing protein [Reinekea forsetii]